MGLSLGPMVPDLLAQGVTTAAIQGSVRAADGSDVDGARVEVVNGATGFVVEKEVRSGRFVVQGLETGGPYSIEIERLGFHPQRIEDVFLELGERRDLAFVLQPGPIPVDTLRVVTRAPFPSVNAHGGTATTIADSVLHRLPTLDRDLYDFVRLVPQISTKTAFAGGGMSGGGVGLRFNDFLIDGFSERTLSGGLTSNQNGGQSVPLDAVREYQVLLAPYDVRYGDFAGALVNTVTRSGTNRFEGSAFAYGRNDHLSRSGAADPYERLQYGFSLGGPVLHDRLHFFVSPEIQHLTSPMPGPWVGQPSTATPEVPVSTSDLARLSDILRGYGLESGSGGSVENGSPLRNVFGRLDLALPEWDSRSVFSLNYARTRNLEFSRDDPVTFPLTSFQSTSSMTQWSASLQLHTALGRAGGGHNELRVSRSWGSLGSLPEVEQPIVTVAVPEPTGSAVLVDTGTPAPAQGGRFEGWRLVLEDTLTLPLGSSHLVTLGLKAEGFHLERGGLGGSFGDWTFSSLDSLEAGLAERYEIRRDFGSASVPLDGGQYSFYAGDQWQVGQRLSMTMGIRGEVLSFDDHAPYNPEVDSIFGRRTDEMPRRRLHLSPRLGFTWGLSDREVDQLRGGIGVFTGRPPLAWIHAGLTSYGVGIGVLRCGSFPNDRGPPPPFVPDHHEAPTACASGAGLTTAPRGDVDLLDSDLRMAQTLRGSLAYDRRLPWDLLVTGEALVTRIISDFVFVNLNLEGPQAVDRYGRVLYGEVNTIGLAAPVLESQFSEVIDLQNTSRNHALQLAARLEKEFSRGIAMFASYTYSRVRDVQTPLRVNNPGIVNWSSRAVSGRHEDLDPEISLNDLPHRVVLAGTYRAPWDRWATEFSFTYVGESGSPFTYGSWGLGGRGDLNADGSNVNDPIYIPLDAFDPDEITFSGRSDEPDADNSPEAQAERVVLQQAAFERFIEGSECLREQRGRILERNGCREPWSHTTIASVRQAIPLAGQAVEAELDVFNVLNLLNGDWGLYKVTAPELLEHVAQTPGPPEESAPVFRYDVAAPEWTTLTTESAFQLQFALRYRF